MTNKKDAFETIDHDFLHIKDYFHNYKFSYIERATKQHFYEKLREKNFAEERILEILNLSKKQLVEVKSISKDAGAVIKDYSARIYDVECEVRRNEEILASEAEKLGVLEAEADRLEERSRNILKQDALNEELKSACNELQSLIREIELKKQRMAGAETAHLREEVSALRAQKEKLQARERRWSKIAMESNVDDLHCWYSRGVELLERIFEYRVKGCESSGNRMAVRFWLRELEIEVLVSDGKLVDASIIGGVELRSFKKIRDFAVRINDARFILVFFLLHLKE